MNCEKADAAVRDFVFRWNIDRAVAIGMNGGMPFHTMAFDLINDIKALGRRLGLDVIPGWECRTEPTDEKMGSEVITDGEALKAMTFFLIRKTSTSRFGSIGVRWANITTGAKAPCHLQSIPFLMTLRLSFTKHWSPSFERVVASSTL